MAKRLTEDQLNWILSIDSTEAQQGIRKLTVANRELEKANKDLRQERTRLDMQGKKQSQEYKNLTASIKENNEKLESNRLLISALEDKIGTAGLTMSQLRKKAQDLQRQLDNTSQATHPAEWNKLNEDLSVVKTRMDELKKSGKQAEDTLGNTIFSKGKMAAFLGNIYTKAAEMGVQAIGKIKEFIIEGSKMAGMAQGIERAFNRISSPDTLSELQQATKGTVNNLELMKAAVKADNFKIPLDELGTLLRFAQQRAQETGESVDYLTNSIVTGIGRKSPLILDNLGISTVRLNEELSKTGDFAKAVGNIAREELAKSGQSIDTAADKAQQRAALLQNIQLSIGQRILGVTQSASSAWNSFLNVINRWISIPTVNKLRDERNEVNVLANAIMSAKGQTETRNLLIKQMNRQYPTFLSNLDTEKLTNEQIVKRLREVNSEYKERIKMQVVNDKILKPQKEKYSKLIEEQTKGFLSLNDMANKSGNWISKSFFQAIQSGDVLQMSVKDIKKELAAMEKRGAGFTRILGMEKIIKRLKEIPSELSIVEKDIERTTSKLSSLGIKQEIPVKENESEPDTPSKNLSNPYEQDLKAVDELISQKRLKISEDYATGLILQDQYNKQLEALELESLNRKLAIYGVGSEERKKIEQQILDYRIRLMESGFNAYISNLDQEAEKDKEQEQKKKEHYDSLNAQIQDFAKNITKEQEKLLKKEIEANEQLGQAILDFAAQAGETLGQSLTDTEASFADAMGNMLLLTLDALRQTTTMAIAETTIKSVAEKGLLGIPLAAAKIALINAAFGAVKGLIKRPSVSNAKNDTSSSGSNTGQHVVTGKESGGYIHVTRAQDGKEFNALLSPGQRGYIGRPTVIVGEAPDSQEWVASNAALKNPTVAPIIQLMNQSQEAGTIRTIDMNQLMRQRLAGFSSGGFITSPSVTSHPFSSSQPLPSTSTGIGSILSDLTAVLSEIKRSGIKSKIVYSEFQKIETEYNKSINIGSK